MKYLILPFLLLSISSCTTVETRSSKMKLSQVSTQKIFLYSYESVWRAAQLSIKYPLSINNMDTGKLETEFIPARDGLVLPQSEPPSSGVKFKIILTLSKGNQQGESGIRVTVSKQIEKRRDFFSEPEPLVSDQIEEKLILYRMERELLIEKAIKKYSETAPSEQPKSD